MTTGAAPSAGWARLESALDRMRPHRYAITVVTDAVVVAIAWNLTYLFRLGFERWWSARPVYDAIVMLGVVVCYAVVFAMLGIPRGMWRFSGFDEVKRLVFGCAVAGALSATLVLLFGLKAIPRAVLALHPVIALMGLAAVRVMVRMLYEHARSQRHADAAGSRRAIVMGAGEAARMLLAGLRGQGWIVAGLLDDDRAKHGARIGGAAVIGTLADIVRPEIVGSATHVIAALPSATAAERRRAVELAIATGLPVLTVPSIGELRDGGRPVERVRAVEPEDLLGRDPVQLDEAGVAQLVRGRVMLVTGAGGSIGSELCRQLGGREPARLVLVDASEFNLYTVDQELHERFPGLPIDARIGDVRDLAQMRDVMTAYRPALVFHAAAYKHVPLVEAGNAWAALRNNVLGTWHAALASAEAGVERFVLVSTDKAVNPTNVMGATKRAAEMAISRLAQREPGTRFMAVRFGNVLGSSGSVIPRFKEQIARGGPVTVTHPDITRYFMTTAEAARLVLQAAAIGETGQVYVLDMGEPVRIVDLARDLIRLAGPSAADVEVVFSGLRPGEKLYEELLADADRTLPTAFAGLRIARLQADDGGVEVLIGLAAAVAPKGDDEVRVALRRAVPEYTPSATIAP